MFNKVQFFKTPPPGPSPRAKRARIFFGLARVGPHHGPLGPRRGGVVPERVVWPLAGDVRSWVKGVGEWCRTMGHWVRALGEWCQTVGHWVRARPGATVSRPWAGGARQCAGGARSLSPAGFWSLARFGHRYHFDSPGTYARAPSITAGFSRTK